MHTAAATAGAGGGGRDLVVPTVGTNHVGRRHVIGEEHTRNARGSHDVPRLVAKAADTLPGVDLNGRSGF